MATRTRERLIDVARQLFARQGLENTTMNDIATASDRGRRTIYTYFRTKGEIVDAVVSTEARRIVSELERLVELQSSPAAKLRALIEYRISVALENRPAHEIWLKSLFTRDEQRAATVRAMVSRRLYEMIDEIVAAGVAAGQFIPSQGQRLASMLTMLVRGSDWTLMSQTDRESFDRWRADCVDFIIDAMQCPGSDSDV